MSENNILIEKIEINNPKLSDGTMGNCERYIFSERGLGIGVQIDYDDNNFTIHNHQFTMLYKIDFVDLNEHHNSSYTELQFWTIMNIISFSINKLRTHRINKMIDILTKKPERSNKMYKQLDLKVYPSNTNTIGVEDDPIYGGAHNYHINLCRGFDQEKNDAIYTGEAILIQFVQKNDDGTVIDGLQSEQLALVLLDRCEKLNARFPSEHNEKQMAGLKMFLEGCEDRVRERINRGVMGELKK